MRLIRDESGAAAAEYGLILACLGGVIALASLGLGAASSTAMDWRHTTGPDGVVHTCTANCKFIYQDYCQTIHDIGTGMATPAPTFVPALPSSDATCKP